MTQVVDEKGRELVHNWYQGRFLWRQQFEGGPMYECTYIWDPDEYYPTTVGVELPDGTKREFSVAASVPEFVRNYRPPSVLERVEHYLRTVVRGQAK